MLKGHHGVCGERGEGRETDGLGIEQTSVAMSRHVAGDTDGRNSAGRRSFDCLQSPPRPSLAHRRRTRLGAAARRTVRVSQSCWGFRGLLASIIVSSKRRLRAMPRACWSSQSWSGRSQRRSSRFTLQFRRSAHPGGSSRGSAQRKTLKQPYRPAARRDSHYKQADPHLAR